MIRLLLVADIRLYREGLAQILGREERLSVAGTAADVDGALTSVRDLRPDVVLIDQAMPESLAAVRAICVLAPDIKVVALAVPDMDQHVVACAEAGVVGYVPRDAGVADLVATIQSVGRGELLCSPKVAATLLKRVAILAAGAGPRGGEGPPTARGLEVFRLPGGGIPNKGNRRPLRGEGGTAEEPAP